MSATTFSPVNGIEIRNVQDIIPGNHIFYKYLANMFLEELQKFMDPYEVVCWMSENIADENTWREVFEKEYKKLQEFMK